MTLDSSEITEHYQRAKPVYESLACIEEYPTIGLNDFVGWYIKRDHDDIETIKAGYPQRGRVVRLDRDYDDITGRVERTLYAVTTYKTPTAFQRWEPCRYDTDEGTTVWEREPPMPDHADLRAVPAWGDIDLADDIKPQRGDLDVDTRRLVENILTAYIDEFATLYGTRDAVYALDSVGGAYVFGAPEATLPIADYFSDDVDALEQVFDAFLDRSNEWLQNAEKRVNSRIDGASAVIQPDWVNNKNRQYKPPLSIHADHDAVVTPVDTENVHYDLCRFEAVDDETIERGVEWANNFTAVEHMDCVDSLVAVLWPDWYDEAAHWQAALDAWVDHEREQDRERQQQREQALHRRQERLEDLDGSLSEQPITPIKQDVYEIVAAVDIASIARDYASTAYNTDPNQPRPQFDPCWRYSESGQSCFVDEQANTFGDSKVNAGGGPAKLMALAAGIITDADDDLDGVSYWDAVDELRNAGYEIPVWIPEAGMDRVDGTEYDQMPFWAVKKAAVAMGICSEDAFVERTGENGTYEGFPDYETYNQTLAAIEDAGLAHGREPVDPTAETDRSEQTIDASSNAEDDSDAAYLREQNRLLKTKVDRLETTLEEKNERIDMLEFENESLRNELDTVRAERNRLENTLQNRQTDHEETVDADSEEDTEKSLFTSVRQFLTADQ